VCLLTVSSEVNRVRSSTDTWNLIFFCLTHHFSSLIERPSYSYRTCISVDGRHWTTCELVFTGTRIHGYSDSHSCLCERTLRLADCCMQLAVDLCLLWTCCATSCPACSTVRMTCCLFYDVLSTCAFVASCQRIVVDLLQYNLLWTCCWLSISCGFVVQHAVQQVLPEP